MKTGKKIGIIIIVSLAAVLMTLAFMTRRPFYKTLEYQAPLAPEIKRIVIRMDADPEQLAILPENTDKATLLVNAHGFGWAWVDYDIRPHIEARSDTLIFTLDIEARSYFAELDHSLELKLPAARKDLVTVDLMPLKNSP